MSTAIAGAMANAPAHAAPITPLDSICDAGWVCLFEDEDYYGDKYERSGATEHFYDLGWWNGDNEISSVKNRSSYYLCLYAGDSPSNDFIRIPPGQYVTSLGDSYGFDNDAESLRLTSGSC